MRVQKHHEDLQMMMMLMMMMMTSDHMSKFAMFLL